MPVWPYPIRLCVSRFLHCDRVPAHSADPAGSIFVFPPSPVHIRREGTAAFLACNGPREGGHSARRHARSSLPLSQANHGLCRTSYRIAVRKLPPEPPEQPKIAALGEV